MTDLALILYIDSLACRPWDETAATEKSLHQTSLILIRKISGGGLTAAIINWLAFKEDYLLKHYTRNTIKVRLCYAKRYYHILLNEDASDLLQIESQQQRQTLRKRRRKI